MVSPDLQAKIAVRALTLEDLPGLLAHQERNTRTSGVAGTPIFTVTSRHYVFDHARRLQHLRECYSKKVEGTGWERGWGAFDGARLIGAADLTTTRNTHTQPHRATLGMGIEPEYRHRGLGSRLLQGCLEWAIAQEFLAWIDLGVFAQNAPARRLYEKFGFIETGRVIDAFRVDDQRIDDLSMVLDLRGRR